MATYRPITFYDLSEAGQREAEEKSYKELQSKYFALLEKKLEGSKMEFDKSKILTVVTADKAKKGMCGWVSNHPKLLESYVKQQKPDILGDVVPESTYPFSDGSAFYSLFYPVPEPEPAYAKGQAKWVRDNDLKVGDKVKIVRDFYFGEGGFNFAFLGFSDGIMPVVEIKENEIIGKFDGFRYHLPYFVLEKVKETYRVYNENELNDLVGTTVLGKFTGHKNLITGITNSGKSVFVGNSCVSLNILLEKFVKEDRTPCGVKE
jgi:hypothetical protein